jgi:hypothetical protein
MIKKERKVFDLMSKEKEDILKKGKKFFLLVSIIVLSCSIIHGQNIQINSRVDGDVAGNGSGVNGTRPFDQDPNNNILRIVRNASVRGNVIGGNSEKGEAIENRVRITGGTIEQSVMGGKGSGTATSNKVFIDGRRSGGVNITSSVYGGNSEKGEAIGNEVEIKGGSIGQSVMGGKSLGNATSNKVGIYIDIDELRSGGVNITSSVYGGSSEKGEAKENEVWIIGGNIGQSVMGGKGLGTATSNKVFIDGLRSGGVNITSSVYGGRSLDGEAKGNEVWIEGGNIGQSVMGGKSLGNATSNKVGIGNGEIRGKVFGGNSEKGEAKENKVWIEVGNIVQSVMGGKSLGTATRNKVVISNGDIKGDVIGGWSLNREAIGNKVIISNGNIDIARSSCRERMLNSVFK